MGERLITFLTGDAPAQTDEKGVSEVVVPTVERSTLGFNFERREEGKPIIKVIGVGSGGLRACERMVEDALTDVSFVAVGTDQRSLGKVRADMMVLLGRDGGGVAGDVDKGREAAEGAVDTIKGLFGDGVSMVFVVAALGGGTGTGAAPVIAREARRGGVLTVSIVTLPFRYEGDVRLRNALRGLEDVRKNSDAVMVLDYEAILKRFPEMSLHEGFGMGGDVIKEAIESVVEIINTEGYVNVDLNDVLAVLQGGGKAIITTARGSGVGRVTKAIRDALNSPLLRNGDENAWHRMLLNLSYDEGASTLMVSEVDELTDFLKGYSKRMSWMKYGIINNDKSLGADVKVTLIVAEEPFLRGRDEKEGAPASEDVYNPLYAALYGRHEAKRHYYVFRPVAMDNDEVINLVSETPTFGRSAQIISTINSFLKK